MVYNSKSTYCNGSRATAATMANILKYSFILSLRYNSGNFFLNGFPGIAVQFGSHNLHYS